MKSIRNRQQTGKVDAQVLQIALAIMVSLAVVLLLPAAWKIGDLHVGVILGILVFGILLAIIKRPRRPGNITAFEQQSAHGAGSFGGGVRAQVFDVVVKQALAGAPWREICAGPMKVNNISPEEVESEIRRRQSSR